MKYVVKAQRSSILSEQNRAFAKKLGVSPVLSSILTNRGYTDELSARNYLYPGGGSLHSPFLLPDMNAAVERIIRALYRKEKILVYGDYDADGVTATAVAYLYLKKKGANVLFHIPDRFSEGYGMNTEAVKAAAASFVSLILTVDTGVKSFNEIKRAGQMNISVVVTDHHECASTLPECEAVVNPMREDSAYPFKGLSGVGVAFKLICALEKELTGTDRSAELLEEYADLVAIGTVADVMQIVDENRYIVKKGLELLNRNTRPGLRTLVAASAEKTRRGPITETTIGFQLAPRINAAGRMAHARIAFDLLVAPSLLPASTLANKLCALNQERQKVEAEIEREAEEQLSAHRDDRFILLAKEGWHRGVIGIAASRICEKYGKPTILLSVDRFTAKGSGRSFPPVNLVSLLSGAEDILLQFGGHEQAAGLTVSTDDIDLLRKRLNDLTPENVVRSAVREVEAELLPEEINPEFCEECALLAPYGQGNEEPLFLLRDARVRCVIPLSEGKHTKLILEHGDAGLTALAFGRERAMLPVAAGQTVDILFTLSLNEYMQRKEVQLIVKDLCPAKEVLEKRAEEYALYKAASNDGIRLDDGLLPTREDFTRLYVFLRDLQSSGTHRTTVSFILESLSLPLLKWYICADVFCEIGLLRIDFTDDERNEMDFYLPDTCERVNLFSASFFKNLKRRE